MTQLKDNNNQSVMPNTTAANVSYGNTNVAAKIAELEQGGGGGGSKPIAGKTVAFFGDSITQGTGGGFVDKVRVKCGLDSAPNYGSSGADTRRLASIMLNDDFREDVADVPKDYTQFDAVVIQIGTNLGVVSHVYGETADIDKDIPDIGIYDITSFPYEYSASGKAITSATVNNAKEFFTKCFGNTFYGNIALCIEYVRYINPNCRIFLTTIPHNIGAGSFDNVRTALLNLAAKMGVQVIDAGAYAGLGVWNIKYWSRDNAIHFNAKGAEMWAAYLANELDKKFYETELS